MTPSVPVDGGSPDTITYPHPHRADRTMTLAEAREHAARVADRAQQRRAVLADTEARVDSPEWEPVEGTPCGRCGEPVGGHDLHGTCPTP